MRQTRDFSPSPRSRPGERPWEDEQSFKGRPGERAQEDEFDDDEADDLLDEDDEDEGGDAGSLFADVDKEKYSGGSRFDESYDALSDEDDEEDEESEEAGEDGNADFEGYSVLSGPHGAHPDGDDMDDDENDVASLYSSFYSSDRSGDDLRRDDVYGRSGQSSSYGSAEDDLALGEEEFETEPMSRDRSVDGAPRPAYRGGQEKGRNFEQSYDRGYDRERLLRDRSQMRRARR